MNRFSISPGQPARAGDFRFLIVILTVCLLFAALVLDFGSGIVETLRAIWQGPRQDVWQQVQANQAIRFGVDSNDWPFAAVDAQGQYVGLNVDVGRALGHALGVQIEFVPVGYDGAYDALLVGKCDALIGGLENDPARLADFIYTGAYFDAGQVMIVKAGTQINTADTNLGFLSALTGAPHKYDLRGKRIAVELGAEADAAARQAARRTLNVTRVERNSPAEALEAIASGQADVAFAEMVWARQALARRAEFHIAGIIQPYPLAIAVRANSPRLQTALNQGLAQLKASGELADIAARWLDRP
jgi:polar amino acid transport system substrate-binding protein